MNDFIAYIHVIEARGLPAKDNSLTSDPYCMVEIGPVSKEKFVTEVKPKNLSPVYEAKFACEIKLTPSQFRTEKAIFSFYDRNDLFRNEFLGLFECGLYDVYLYPDHKLDQEWVPITKPEYPSQQLGALLISIHVLSPNDSPPSYYPRIIEPYDILQAPVLNRKGYLLNVFCYRGKDLIAASGSGKCDAFISVRFNGSASQTRAIYSNTAPAWNTRLGFPFYTPLYSHSITVQIWNKNTHKIPPFPDQFIGEAHFMETDVVNKPWGPAWVPIYSTPQDNLIGGPTFEQNSQNSCEYVGSLLLRMSVRPYREPQLEIAPCPPVEEEPPSEEYALHFALYSAFELPVLGGRIYVEVCFGEHRIQSKPTRCSKGVAIWDPEMFEPIFSIAPKELSQVPDVIISLFHLVGLSSSRIAYLRIPVAWLKVGKKGRRAADSSYTINGDSTDGIYEYDWKPPNAGAHWVVEFLPSHWVPLPRVLNHVTPLRGDQPPVIAGILQFSIGFGLRSSIDEIASSLPLSLPINPVSFLFRAIIYQARNIPAAISNGTSNTFIAVRVGYRTEVTHVVKNTCDPVFYTAIEIPISICWEFHPCVTILAYHEDNVGNTLLGSAKIEFSEDMKQTLDVPQRYRLLKNILGDTESDTPLEPIESSPYVVCSFQLLPEVNVAANTIKNAPFQLSMDEYTIRMHSLGIRKMIPFALNSVNSPYIELSCPSIKLITPDGTLYQINPEIENRSLKTNTSKVIESAASIIEEIDLHVSLPKQGAGMKEDTLLSSCAITLRVYDSRALGDVLVGSSSIPFTSVLLGHKSKVNNKIEEKKYEKKEMKENKEIELDIFSEIKPPDIVIEPAENVLSPLDEEYANMSTVFVEHLELGFIYMIDGKFSPLSSSLATTSSHVVSGTNLQEEYIGEEMEIELKESDDNYDNPTYRSYILIRGKTAGVSNFENLMAQSRIISLLVGNTSYRSDKNRIEACIIKANILATTVSQELQLPINSYFDQLIGDLFNKQLNVCVYIFRALNLTPSGWNSSVSPYIVVTNGHEEANRIVFNEINFHNEPSPEFYTTVQIPALLPENGNIEIAIWNKEGLPGTDRLIGFSNIDIEDRLLSREWQKRKKSRDPKTMINNEWRTLHHPASTLGQGKIEVKIDVIGPRDKPEDLYPPPPEDMELRLVIWSTSRIRHTDDLNTDKINQLITVKENFTGNYETIKETDKAWSIRPGGDASWNWRMNFPVTLPCKVPRLLIQIWDYDTLGTGPGTMLGEVQFNLGHWFSSIKRDGKEKRVVTSKKDLQFIHSQFPCIEQGELRVQCFLVSKSLALRKPVGDAQDEPNEDPYLQAPARNLPPYAIASKTIALLGWFARHKIFLALLFFLIILMIFIVPLVFQKLSASVF